MKEIIIGNKKIGRQFPPFVIAELSGNHYGKIDQAKKLIEAAKNAGASAVKLQTFTPNCLTLDTDDPTFELKSGNWIGKRLFDLYSETQTPLEWHDTLFEFAKQHEIIIFSSPFSVEMVNFLDGKNVPAYKVASNEAQDLRLIQAVAEKQKPVLISSGASTYAQFEKSIKAIKATGNQSIVGLYCVSAYPTPINMANVNSVGYILEKLNIEVGLSDHSLGHAAAVAAIAKGASVIEKHFTLNRSARGPDDKFSLEPDEFQSLVDNCNESWEALGVVNFPTLEQLQERNIFLRQLWTNRPITKGEKLTWSNVRSIRGPSNSGAVSAMDCEQVIGKFAMRDIGHHCPITVECAG